MRIATAVFGVFFLLSGSGCTEPVVSDLSESEANRVLASIERGGFAAEKTMNASDGRYRVEVGRGDTSAALAILAREGLPSERRPGLLETLGDGALVPSRANEHARLLSGTAAELERTLSDLEGVVSARVHVAAPEKTLLDPASPAVQPKASVLLRHRGASPSLSEDDVRRLVAGAVSGLSPQDVTVVAVEAPPPEATSDVARLGPITTTRGSARFLRWSLAGIASLNIVLVTVLFGLLFRARRARAEATMAVRGADS